MEINLEAHNHLDSRKMKSFPHSTAETFLLADSICIECWGKRRELSFLKLETRKARQTKREQQTNYGTE
jgi:hypothetical protein